MNRFIFFCGMLFLTPTWAQETSSLLKPINELSSLGDHTGSKEPKVRKAGSQEGADLGKGKNSKATEIICSQGVTFDEKSRVGVFTGNVRVKDPQFTLSSEKLTVILRKEPAASGTNKAAAVPSGESKTKEADALGGGLDRAIAEGNVVVIQEKPAEDGGEPRRYIGKAARMEYDSKTGDVTLTGWPQIQQGINTQAATEEGTVMVLNRDGRLKTTGGCHTLIQPQSEAKGK